MAGVYCRGKPLDCTQASVYTLDVCVLVLWQRESIPRKPRRLVERYSTVAQNVQVHVCAVSVCTLCTADGGRRLEGRLPDGTFYDAATRSRSRKPERVQICALRMDMECIL